MDVVLTIAGIAPILVSLHDTFHTPPHLRGKGTLSQAVTSVCRRASATIGHRLGSTAGPAGMVAVVCRPG